MRLKLTILALFVFTLASATKYYVATTGNDANAGTIGAPYLTWQKGATSAVAGDTVYIRGGTYAAPVNWYAVRKDNKDGTSGNPICIWNYPGETPIMSCENLIMTTGSWGIELLNCDWWHLKGLTIRNASQKGTSYQAMGIRLNHSNNIIIERCTVYGIGGPGIAIYGNSENNYIKNCDSYDNYDPTSASPGGNADGFVIGTIAERAGNERHNYISGCRAWNNSDDGLDMWNNEGFVHVDSVWAWSNGYDQGNGSGIKLGQTQGTAEATAQRIVRNCLVYDNKSQGFDNSEAHVLMHFYNNTSHANGIRGFQMAQYTYANVFKNNISYLDPVNNFTAYVVHTNNSWDASPSVTITSADFVTLNPGSLLNARQSNGRLPVIDFLRIASGSDLINAGTDIGLPYIGANPDLGLYEFVPPAEVDLPNNVWFLDGNGTDQMGNNSGDVTGGGAYTTTQKVQGTHSFYSATDNDRFSTTSALNLGSSGWVFIKGEARIETWANYPVLFSNRPTGAGSGCYLFVDAATGRLIFRTNDGTTTNDAISSNSAVSANTWFQWSVLIDLTRGYASIFKDNTEVTGSDSTIHTTWTKSAVFTIGAEGNGGGTIFGQEDNVQVYKRFISTGNRTLLYNNRASEYWLSQSVAQSRRRNLNQVLYFNTDYIAVTDIQDTIIPPDPTNWTILFAQDFTTSTNSASGRYQFDKVAQDFDLSYNGWDTDMHIVDSADVDGGTSKMVRIDYPFRTYATQHGTEFTSWIQPEGPDYDGSDIIVSCNVKIKNGFMWNRGGKFIGLDMHSSVDYSPGGAAPAGSQGSHGHYVWQGEGMGRFYDYTHTGAPAPYYGTGPFVYYRFETGKWYNIAQRFIKNTTSPSVLSDGAHEMFVNGKLVAAYTGIKWSERDTVGFNELRFSWFMGGDSTFRARRDEYILVDDVEIFTDASLNRAAWDPDVPLVPPGKVGSFTEKSPTVYTASSGNVRNASYPNNYASYAFEVHKIHANPGQTITITPTLVKLGSADYVVVIDGDSPTDVYGNTLRTYGLWDQTQTTTNAPAFTSIGSDVTIILAADPYNNGSPTGLSFSFAYTIQ